MNKRLRFGLSQVKNSAPKWVINTTSIVALLIAAKHYLIDELPGISVATKQLLMGWFEYGLNTAQVILALGVIFLGQEEQYHDTTRDLNN
ncbi:MAG: hypothetical protein R2800_07980 [Flavipsychrobacter sp.]